MQYFSKYLKYKQKYISLKQTIIQYGKGNDDDIIIDEIEDIQLSPQERYSAFPEVIPCNDLVVYQNTLGTCWNISIQMILFFGDKTRIPIQTKILTNTSETIYNEAERLLEKFLPYYLLNENGKVKYYAKGLIIRIIDILKKRIEVSRTYYNEVVSGQLTKIIPIEPDIRKPKKYKTLEEICEKDFAEKYFQLFHKKSYKEGGYTIDRFFLLNLLSILFLNKLLNIKTSITNQEILDDTLLGVIVSQPGHVKGFYTCSGVEKYIDNHEITNYLWKSKIMELNNDNTLRLAEKKPNILEVIKATQLYSDLSYEVQNLEYIQFYDESNYELFKTDYLLYYLFLYIINGDNTAANNIIDTYKILNQQDNLGNSAIMYAIIYKNYTIFDKLLELNCNLNFINRINRSPLIAAIYSRDNIIIDKLLKIQNIDLNLQNYRGNAAIIHAILVNDYDIIHKLIKRKCNLNIQNNNGNTPLIYSIDQGLIPMQIVPLLVKNKADLDLQNNKGKTPLMIAIKKNLIPIAQLLIEYKCKLDLQNYKGDTALLISIDKELIPIARLLIENKCDLDIRNNKGDNALILSINNDLISITKLLIENKCILDMQYEGGNTALIHSINKGLIPIVEMLIEYKCNLDITNHKGNTALIIAISKNLMPIIQLLIKNNCNLDIQNQTGNTALMISINLGLTHIAQLLIQNNCDLNIKNGKGETALMIAENKQNNIIIQEIISKNI